MQNNPIMQTVYDAAGNAFTVEPVDAREYVASGSYFNEAPAADTGEVTDKPKRGRKATAEAPAADTGESAQG